MLVLTLFHSEGLQGPTVPCSRIHFSSIPPTSEVVHKCLILCSLIASSFLNCTNVNVRTVVAAAVTNSRHSLAVKLLTLFTNSVSSLFQEIRYKEHTDLLNLLLYLLLLLLFVTFRVKLRKESFSNLNYVGISLHRHF